MDGDILIKSSIENKPLIKFVSKVNMIINLIKKNTLKQVGITLVYYSESRKFMNVGIKYHDANQEEIMRPLI
jgi:hypothetical protein